MRYRYRTAIVCFARHNEFRLEDVVCHETLGGLLKHFERRAA